MARIFCCTRTRATFLWEFFWKQSGYTCLFSVCGLRLRYAVVLSTYGFRWIGVQSERLFNMSAVSSSETGI